MPNICKVLQPLQDTEPSSYCSENQWNPKDGDFQNQQSSNSSLQLLENLVYNYAKDNLIILHLSIKDPYAQKFQKEEKMPIISYIANIGGLLGLWLGFSIITGVEMLYHVLNSIISIIIKAQDKDTTMAENNVEIAHNPRKANMV